MKRESLNIRIASTADAEAICRLHVESVRVNCAPDYTPEQIEAWAGPKQPQHYIDGMNRGEFMLVAEENDQIIGFAALAGDEMRALYVSPKFLRRGIGKALLRGIEEEALRQGINPLKLESTITAERFYESQGFKRGRPNVHVMKGVDIPCVEMSKAL
jgi:putative acetyltransferase